MGSFGKYWSSAGMPLLLCFAFCGVAWAGSASPPVPAQTVEAAAPPPVPLYSTGVTKTTIFGPGMIVIDTRDPFEAVLDWYRINLKDRTADVALDGQHHRYVTHDGASVDVAAEGSGADAGTKISLFWKSNSGPLPQSGPAAEPAKAVSIQPMAPLAGIEPLPAPAEAQVAMMTPARIELLAPADARPAEPKPPELQGAAYLKEGRYDEALVALQDAAGKGSAAAALDLGMMYDAGLGVPQNYQTAFSWYELAAEKGDPVAIYNIGVLNDAGLGLRRNPAEAVDHYTQAAAKGIGRAAFNLALLYERGDGVEQNEGAAEQYFRRAERLGVRAARAHLSGRRGVRMADADDSDLPFNTVHTIGGDASGGRRSHPDSRAE